MIISSEVRKILSFLEWTNACYSVNGGILFSGDHFDFLVTGNVMAAAGRPRTFLDRLVDHASQDETRPSINSITVTKDGKGLLATDGHTLYRLDVVDVEGEMEPGASYALPAMRAAQEILRAGGKASASHGSLYFKLNDAWLTIRLFGSYPMYEQSLPDLTDGYTTEKVTVEQILNSPRGMVDETVTRLLGSAANVAVNVAVNVDLILRAVKGVGTKNSVQLSVKGPLDPIVITGQGFSVAIMPMNPGLAKKKDK